MGTWALKLQLHPHIVGHIHSVKSLSKPSNSKTVSRFYVCLHTPLFPQAGEQGYENKQK